MLDTNQTTMNAEAAARAFSDQLRKYVQRRVAGTAQVDDIVQEVMLRVVRNEETFRATTNPLAWLYTVARSVVIDHYRREGRPQPDFSELYQVEEQAPELCDLSLCVEPLIHQLPTIYGQTLRQVDIFGETNKIVAEREGTSISAIKSRTQRGRRLLRQAIIASCKVEVNRRGQPIAVEPPSPDCCAAKI